MISGRIHIRCSAPAATQNRFSNGEDDAGQQERFSTNDCPAIASLSPKVTAGRPRRARPPARVTEAADISTVPLRGKGRPTRTILPMATGGSHQQLQNVARSSLACAHVAALRRGRWLDADQNGGRPDLDILRELESALELQASRSLRRCCQRARTCCAPRPGCLMVIVSAVQALRARGEPGGALASHGTCPGQFSSSVAAVVA